MTEQSVNSIRAPEDYHLPVSQWKEFEVVSIDSTDHPYFDEVYKRLWTEFGDRNELETQTVLERRFQWRHQPPLDGIVFDYEMVGIFKDKVFVGARDHTVMILEETHEAIVHLSHALLAPDFRRKGLGAWLRMLPILKAEQCLEKKSQTKRGAITLVAEMEPLDLNVPESVSRLKSYKKGAFQMLDPVSFDYMQPDFRDPRDIDRSGGPKGLSLQLMIRHVGSETKTFLSGIEVLKVITSMYRMYELSFRTTDMAPIWQNLSKQSLGLIPRVNLVDPLLEYK